LHSLKNRPFSLLWAGQTTSRLGDSLYRIALAWWVLEKTGSATAMGTLLVFSQIPILIFFLVGGVVVDWLQRLRVMFISDILSGLVITFIAVFSWLDLLLIWHIYIASMIFGFIGAFFFPAYQAVIPQITPPELLTSANSLNGLSQRVTGIIGPALGATLVASGGTSLTFGLDALSFSISALCVLPILRSNLDQVQRQEKAVETGASQKLVKDAIRQGFRDLREGFKFVFTIPWIWVTILIFGFVNITEASPRAVAMPFLIKQDLGTDVESHGIFGSSASLGFVVGMIWLGQYVRLHRRGWLAGLSFGRCNRVGITAFCVQTARSGLGRVHVHQRTFHVGIFPGLDIHFTGNGSRRIVGACLFHRRAGFVRFTTGWVQPSWLGDRSVWRTDRLSVWRAGHDHPGIAWSVSPRDP